MTALAARRVRPSWLALATALLVLRVWESRGLVKGYDALVYWSGAHAFVHGADPYSLPTFVVPPSGLLLISPLGWLSFPAAYAVFQVAAATAMVAGVGLLLARFGASRQVAALGALLLVTWTSGTFQTFGFGNLNGVILLTWVLCLLATDRGDDRAAGLWFGLGLALKPVLAPVGLVLLLQRRWSAALWSLAAPLGLTAVTLALGDGPGFLTKALPAITRGFGQQFNAADLSINAVAHRHGIPGALSTGLRGLAVVVTAVVALAVWRAARASDVLQRGTVRLLDVGSVLLLGTLLAAPFGWRYYSVFLLPWFLHLVWTRRASLSTWHVVGWALLLLPDSLGLKFDRGGAWGLNQDRPTLAVLLLLVAAYADTRRRTRPGVEPVVGEPAEDPVVAEAAAR